MYGTVAKIRIKPGLVDEAIEMMEKSGNPDPSKGAVATHLYQMDSDPNEFYLVVLYEDKEKYFANADDPQTNENFQEMAKYFAAEPEWNDGEIVHTWSSE